jgi:hypothetical protein
METVAVIDGLKEVAVFDGQRVTDGAAVTTQSKRMATLAEGERKKCNGQRPAIEDH